MKQELGWSAAIVAAVVATADELAAKQWAVFQIEGLTGLLVRASPLSMN